MHAFVVMPNHVHLLFTPIIDSNGEPHPLAEIMNEHQGSIKSQCEQVDAGVEDRCGSRNLLIGSFAPMPISKPR